jgi:queuosine precursor transporter
MNELIFIVHTVIIAAFALGALALGQAALVAFVCICCILANLFVVKQITLFCLTATCADAFTVGATIGLNMLQEYFGKKITKKTIWINFFLLIFYAIVSQIHLIYIPHTADTMHLHFMPLLGFMPRIVIASFSVYWISQMTDYYLYGFLKKTLKDRYIIFRNYASIAFCQLLDTILFSFLGLYGIIDNIWEVIIISYVIKLASIIIATPFVGMSRKIYKMTHSSYMTLFITAITMINYTFCMEKEHHNKYAAIENFLRGYITTTEDGIEYNSLSGDVQYNMLKGAISDGDMHLLSLHLKYKFNPNRYHKKLSLLHHAVQRHKPQAIMILAQYNPDLIPLNKKEQTPLDYAKSLKCDECFNAMAHVIRRKYNRLALYQEHCGLTKHLINAQRPCLKCRAELGWHLELHGISNRCLTNEDLEEVLVDLKS